MFNTSDDRFSARTKHGAGPSALRVYNEHLILGMLHIADGLSAADLARMTGLSAQSISVILGHLEENGLVMRGQPKRGKVGQPSVPILLNPDGAFVLGAKIGRRSADITLMGLDGKLRAHFWCDYDWPDPDVVMDWLRQNVLDLSKQVPKLDGIGIALPSRLWDWAERGSLEHTAMQAWTAKDIIAGLSDMSVNTIVLNDGAAACAAEMTFGVLPHGDDVIYLFVGTFIGGGLTQKGHLVLGPTGNAGSFGSVLVTGPNGSRQPLIEVASLISLEHALQVAAGPPVSQQNLGADWDMTHPILENWLSTAAKGIAEAIVSAIAISDCRLIVIDGALPKPVLAALVSQVAVRVTQVPHVGIDLPRIQQGTMGPLARAIGAGAVVLNEYFFGWPTAIRPETVADGLALGGNI